MQQETCSCMEREEGTQMACAQMEQACADSSAPHPAPDDPRELLGREGQLCGDTTVPHVVWGSYRPHFDEFGGILTLVWPSVLGALWSTCSGELW